MKKYDVFISYRRSNSWSVARLLYERLINEGLNVFLDVDELKEGKFDENLYKFIESSPNFVLVLAPGSLDSCSNPNDWVRKEVLHAMECNKNIITVFVDGFSFEKHGKNLPKEIASIKMFNGVEINDKLFDASINNLIRFLQNVNIKRAGLTDQREKNTLYTGEVSDVEVKRLQLQKKFDNQIDIPIFDKILAQYDKVNVLDVSCTPEDVMDYLGKHEKVQNLVSVNYSKANVDTCKAKYGNEKTQFYLSKIESEEFEKTLDSIVAKNNFKFDIIHVSYLLLLLSDPYLVIKKLHNYLSDKGTIVIIDIDDGFSVAFPDKDNKFKRAEAIRRLVPSYCGNRFTGREIYRCLKRSGYQNIKLENTTFNLNEYDAKERGEIFDIWFSWILSDIKEASEADPDNEKFKKEYLWLQQNYEDLELDFQNNLFFYATSHIVYLANK